MAVRFNFVPLTERARKTTLSQVEFLDLNRVLDELARMDQVCRGCATPLFP
jgi:hypothetical protein